jgi:hypothetical protein
MLNPFSDNFPRHRDRHQKIAKDFLNANSVRVFIQNHIPFYYFAE